MNKYNIVSLLAIATLIYSCKPSGNQKALEDTGEPMEIVVYNNPPADGFDFENSHTHAIVMADQIMNAMGGRQKWDDTRVISWNFLGIRNLLWDKKDNRVRIDWPDKDLVIAVNMDDMSGKVWQSGIEMTDADSLATYLEKGKNIWINDSYWLVMPFKLKDSGVALTYAREDTTQAGKRADVLRMTFANVGETPQNAYEVWVDYETRLIEQWAYFKEANQLEPNFVKPWTDYKDYDGVLLSGERGERDLTEIKVLKKAPKGAFDSPEKPEL